jgi:prepilin-type N-terminal cleavage/methylation domain-containing protein
MRPWGAKVSLPLTEKRFMRKRTRFISIRSGERGFGLLEILIVVAIIALLASIAIPALSNAMRKSKRNTAVSDLRVFRDSMNRYAIDIGRFPLSGEFDYRTLAPLRSCDLQEPSKVLRLLKGKKIDFYFPWNLFDDPLPLDWSTSPQGFFIIATLDYDPDIRFIVTDNTIYYYIDYYVYPVGDN